MSAVLRVVEGRRSSFEEYLLAEQMAEERHEYVNGEVVAMAGASENHERVAGKAFYLVFGHLRGKPCRAFKGDMKLRFQAGPMDLGYYPDVFVTCDPADDRTYYKTKPKLIIEVMTEFKTDHLEKLFVYQQFSTLEEYLVIDQEPATPRVWLYDRAGKWAMPEPVTSGEIHLRSIGLTLRIEDLYAA